MTTVGEGTSSSERAGGFRSGRVSFLDQALWKQFAEATAEDTFVRAWLGLLCRLIGGAARAVAVLGEPDEGPFAPAAFWPDESAVDEGLSAVAEMALAERRGVVQGADEDQSGNAYASYPFVVDERLYGVVALGLDSVSRGQLRTVMRQLQWGVGWVEVMLRRDQVRGNEAHLDRIDTAFDFVAAALEHERFRTSCNATVTELATRLECDQVAIGFVQRRRVVVAALSHVAQFGQRMNLVRDIGNTMDEAIDQSAIVVFPPREDWDYRITRAHAELARAENAGSILTIPLHVGGRFFGALTLQRAPGAEFDEQTIDLCDCIATVVGPILEEKRLNDRLIFRKIGESIWVQLKRLLGPRYFGRKLATAVAAVVVAFFAIVKDDYRVTSPATLEGTIQRSIIAPFDGYIAEERARAGDVVRDTDLLAKLDDKDLGLERLRWLTKVAARRAEYDQALAERKRAQSRIIQAQIAEAEAQVDLLDAEIARAELRAPFDGIVISGDLSQSIGAAVRRGDELFKIAPLDSYRVILEVDESDLDDIRVGQTGTLVVSSMPKVGLPYVVKRITPIAEATEGRNVFRVEARLDEVKERLRPGMGGVAKTNIEERLLIRIWTDKLIAWIRLTMWEWLP